LTLGVKIVGQGHKSKFKAEEENIPLAQKESENGKTSASDRSKAELKLETVNK